jgi:cytoskeleton protein RodZ
MTSEAGGSVRGIGARLRAARERKGLTVLQAAEKLHVDARMLEALEAEDFAALGAAVYVRGHLRRYAEAVGESPVQLQELLAGNAHAARPDLTRIPHSEPGKPSARLLPSALLLIIGCALAGLLWWLITLPGEKAQPLAVGVPAPASGAPRAPDEGTVRAVAEVPTGAAPALPSARSAVGLPSRSSAAGATGAAAAVQLALQFSAQSWVEISDADGRRLLHGLIEAGSARTLNGAAPLRVVLGNAPAVALRLNGQPVTLERLVHHDGSAHVLIDATGHASAAGPRLAHGE